MIKEEKYNLKAGCKIWNKKDGNKSTANLNNKLFSLNALKVCLYYPSCDISHEQLHVITNRTTLDMFSYCKLTLMSYKVIFNNIPIVEPTHLNFSQVFTSCGTNFISRNTNLHKIGMDVFTNRFYLIKN